MSMRLPRLARREPCRLREGPWFSPPAWPLGLGEDSCGAPRLARRGPAALHGMSGCGRAAMQLQWTVSRRILMWHNTLQYQSVMTSPIQYMSAIYNIQGHPRAQPKRPWDLSRQPAAAGGG